MKKKLVIFGAGKLGNTLYYNVSDQFEVVFYIDNKNVQPEQANGKPIYKPDYLLSGREWDYVLISSVRFIKEMSNQLESMGFSYGDRYLTPYDVMANPRMIDAGNYLGCRRDLFLQQITRVLNGRRICVLFGNCQTETVSRLLVSVPQFHEKYLLIKIPAIYDPSCRKAVQLLIDSGVFGRCSLLISQHIEKTNRFFEGLSSDFLKSELPEYAMTVKIPNLFMKGYFPDAYDLKAEGRALPQYYGETGLFANGYREIDRLLRCGFTAEKIIEEISRPDLYKKEDIRFQIEKEIHEFSEREKHQNTDIIISDYLLENYDKELLFHCFRHPSLSVLIILAQRILQYLNIKQTIYCDHNLNLYTQNYSMLVYPSVISALGLDDRYHHMVYYPCSGQESGLTFSECVHRYCNYVNVMQKEEQQNGNGVTGNE